ncbi:MAG: hypothetical protein RR971_01095 [Alistipes sp.]
MCSYVATCGFVGCSDCDDSPESKPERIFAKNLSDIQSLASILQDENVMYAYNGAFNEEEIMAWMQKQLQRYKEFEFGLWVYFSKIPTK